MLRSLYNHAEKGRSSGSGILITGSFPHRFMQWRFAKACFYFNSFLHPVTLPLQRRDRMGFPPISLLSRTSHGIRAPFLFCFHFPSAGRDRGFTPCLILRNNIPRPILYVHIWGHLDLARSFLSDGAHERLPYAHPRCPWLCFPIHNSKAPHGCIPCWDCVPEALRDQTPLQ